MRVQDAFFLYTDTRNVHQQVGGLIMVDRAGRPPVSIDWLREHVAARLSRWPRLRHRLAFPRRRLARPVWVDDDAFDLDHHVRAVILDGADDRTLSAYAATALAEPLDWRRPLWEVHLVSDLAGGGQAVLVKVHHSVADGLGSIALVQGILFDPAPDGGPAPSSDGWRPLPAPDAATVLTTAAREQLRATWGLAQAGWRAAASSPRESWRQVATTAQGFWALARAGPAPASPVNAPIGPRRRLMTADLPLAEFLAVRSRFKVTATELMLALASAVSAEIVARSPRRSPPAPTQAPTTSLRASVPVSTRTKGPLQAGSWSSAKMVDIPATAMDPGERVSAVREAMRPLRSSAQPRASRFVMAAVGSLTPPAMHAAASRWMYRGRWFNLIATHMPGPTQPLYLDGCPVPAAYPMVPLAEGVGLAVGSVRWNEIVGVGITTDPDAVGELPGDVLTRFWAELRGC